MMTAENHAVQCASGNQGVIQPHTGKDYRRNLTDTLLLPK